MKVLLTIVVGTGLFAIGAAAQHDEHHTDQGASASQAETARPGMQDGMMSHMPQMMSGQQETAKVAEELLKSFAAIQSEKDPVALKAKLEAHGELLKQLQAKVQGQTHMMEMMHHMMSGEMMGGANADKK
jgi:hypothetical protein